MRSRRLQFRHMFKLGLLMQDMDTATGWVSPLGMPSEGGNVGFEGMRGPVVPGADACGAFYGAVPFTPKNSTTRIHEVRGLYASARRCLGLVGQ